MTFSTGTTTPTYTFEVGFMSWEHDENFDNLCVPTSITIPRLEVGGKINQEAVQRELDFYGKYGIEPEGVYHSRYSTEIYFGYHPMIKRPHDFDQDLRFAVTNLERAQKEVQEASKRLTRAKEKAEKKARERESKPT